MLIISIIINLILVIYICKTDYKYTNDAATLNAYQAECNALRERNDNLVYNEEKRKADYD